MAKNKEVKQKKQKKDKKQRAKINQKTFLSVVVVGLCVVVLLYVFVYLDYTQRTEELEDSNAVLQATIDELQVYADNMSQYQDAINDMESQIQESLAEYPADAREEDIIMLAVAIQEDNDVTFNSIAMDDSEVLYDIPDTLITPLGMEGYDSNIGFVRKSASYVNETDYGNLKSVIEQIFDSPNRIGIDAISYSKNDEDATLEGGISLYFYSASGSGKEYSYPDIADYRAGTSDMFKTGSEYRAVEETGIEDEEENGESKAE